MVLVDDSKKCYGVNYVKLCIMIVWKWKFLIVIEVAKLLYVNLFCSPYKCGWIRACWDWNRGKTKKMNNWKRWGTGVSKEGTLGS